MKNIFLIFGLLLALYFPANAQSPLCASYPTTFCCEYVSSVTINGVTKAGAPDATGFNSGPGYFNYTDSVLTTLHAGTMVPVSVTVKTSDMFKEYVKIWFDFNGNGDLSNSGELVFDQNNTFNGSYTYTGSVAIPSTAFNGDVFFRIIMAYNSAPQLCGSYGYGTTLDFKATITGGLLSHKLTTSIAGSGGFSGNISSTPSGINTASGFNSANFADGSIVSVTAVPASGGSFLNWTGDVSGSSNPLSVIMSSGKNIVANFGAPIPSDPTSVTVSTSNNCSGSSAELTANGSVGSVYWYSGGCGEQFVGTGNPITVNPVTTTTYYARNSNSSGFSAGCASGTVLVNSNISTTIYNGTPSICYNTEPEAITATGNGGAGVYTYLWYKNGISTGVTTQTYSPGTLTETSSFYCAVSSGSCGAVNTSSTNIIVYNDFNAGNIFVDGETICFNGDPAAIGSSINASGGDELISYQWQSCLTDDFAAPITVSNNQATFDPPSGLLATTWYRRLAKDGTCSDWKISSGTWKVTVVPGSVGGSISGGNVSIIYGNTTGIMTLGNQTGTVLKWQKRVASESWVDINVTTITYSENPSAAGLWQYRAQVQNGTCNAAFSDPLNITVQAKTIIVTPIAGQNKVYGESDPTPFQYSFAPSLEGTDLISGQLSRVAGENAGTYAYTAGTLTAGSNYNLIIAGNPVFGISLKMLSVVATDITKCYDGTIYSEGYSVSYNGFVNGDDESSLSGSLVFEGTAIQAFNPGSYSIVPSGLTSVNYSLMYTDGILVIESAPVPAISGLNTACAGSTGIMYTTEVGFSNYTWTISCGGVITGGINSNQIMVDWVSAGSHLLTVNYENTSGCSSVIPAEFIVSVLSAPAPTITGENSVCSGSTNSIYTTEANNTNYQWSVSPGGYILAGSGTNSITVDWQGTGDQSVNVGYSNSLGCQSPSDAEFMVYVSPLPVASGPIEGANVICSGRSGVNYSVAPIEFASTYEWTLPANTTITSGLGTPNIIVDFSPNSTSGIIAVQGVNDCGSGITSADFSVQVNASPAAPTLTQHGDTLISSSDEGNQWFLDGIEIPGAISKEYFAQTAGTYYVVVNNNECNSEPSNSILILHVSISPSGNAPKFDVYPNPSNGVFTIQIEAPRSSICNIEVYNQLGVLIWHQNDVQIDGDYLVKADLNQPDAGIYTVKLRNQSITTSRKIVILR